MGLSLRFKLGGFSAGTSEKLLTKTLPLVIPLVWAPVDTSCALYVVRGLRSFGFLEVSV